MYRDKLNLRNVVMIIASLAVTAMFSSCDKKQENADFYDIEYRIGQWISPVVENDTLEFVSSTVLIRKNYNAKPEYLYRIENNTLIISLPNNGDSRTFHSILKVEKDIVVLDNMYGGVGFFDSSGTFRKAKNASR